MFKLFAPAILNKLRILAFSTTKCIISIKIVSLISETFLVIEELKAGIKAQVESIRAIERRPLPTRRAASADNQMNDNWA